MFLKADIIRLEIIKKIVDVSNHFDPLVQLFFRIHRDDSQKCEYEVVNGLVVVAADVKSSVPGNV